MNTDQTKNAKSSLLQVVITSWKQKPIFFNKQSKSKLLKIVLNHLLLWTEAWPTAYFYAYKKVKRNKITSVHVIVFYCFPFFCSA